MSHRPGVVRQNTHLKITPFGTEASSEPHDKHFTMPIWVASPPTQKEKRKRTVTSLDDSNSGSDSNNEDHNNDEETHVKRHILEYRKK